ncbi:MAG: hypothetical protein HFH80_03820 [Lachnospiraceae bacterium]|nr:hypothetical protein [Lachnospiraceae bacterium]
MDAGKRRLWEKDRASVSAGRGISMGKMIKNTIFTLLFLTLSVSTAVLAYLHFSAPDYEDPSGEWVASLNMAEQAAVVAYSWLQDIEAVSVSLEEMESCMQGLTIQVNLTLEPTARSEGTFRCIVLPESYDACQQAAYEALARAFQKLLAERLRMAGYTGSMEQEALEALATESFGMPTVSYLMSCGPALLPPLEDLQIQYDGSGVYEATGGVLVRYFERDSAATAREQHYIREDSRLILFEETGSSTSGLISNHFPMVYKLTPQQNP